MLVTSRTVPSAIFHQRRIIENLGRMRAQCTDIPSRVHVVDISRDGLGFGASALETLVRDAGFAGMADAHAVVYFDESVPPTAETVVLPARWALGAADGYAPAVRLEGQVLSVKPLRKGEGVSYGYSHRAETDTRVALVTGGYGQGIVRSLGNQLRVSISGVRYPIVGRVAMDVCVVDVGSAAIEVNTPVVFLGDPARNEPDLAEWSTLTGMTVDELLAPLGLWSTRKVMA